MKRIVANRHEGAAQRLRIPEGCNTIDYNAQRGPRPRPRWRRPECAAGACNLLYYTLALAAGDAARRWT